MQLEPLKDVVASYEMCQSRLDGSPPGGGIGADRWG
jgi:hypothetical protein